ncbi:hypothetical protein [Psychrobacter glacincola]|uniref:Uncharacterized protein n=1 Tax=Psychrobacter glacincola TaxID=56810 RepID=A0ABW1W4H8_9GAMM|nr:hypothetical protein [Psychrobacter glacincola]
MTWEVVEQTKNLNLKNTYSEQDDLELVEIAKQRMNDGQIPIPISLEDL